MTAPDPLHPKVLLDEEPAADGHPARVATIFLVNRRCPWRCVMCDLHRQALPESLPPGGIPRQVADGLRRADGAGILKLYNAGSWFDEAAVPPEDDAPVAGLLRTLERILVESHPALLGDRVLSFRDLLRPATLEVAMGLEAADEKILLGLQKGMTLESFSRAARFLADAGIPLRAFVLVRPPVVRSEEEALDLALRSISFAFDAGAATVSLIPTRPGNDALAPLAAKGLFSPPRLATLEAALAAGLALGRGRVLADLWDLPLFADCPACLPARKARLHAMNLAQRALPGVACGLCRGSAPISAGR